MPNNNPKIAVILPVYNKEFLIGRVTKSIMENTSDSVTDVFFIIDGCTDKSEDEIYKNLIYKRDELQNHIFYTPNLNEVKASNVGFKGAMEICNPDYFLAMQDDMILAENNFDLKMLKPFLQVPNLIGVTARNAANELMDYSVKECYSVFGKDINSPKGVLGIRDIIVRGPIMWDAKKMQEMNYLNEDYAPIQNDDKDLSYRAYKEKGYLVGAYMVDYQSENEWGTTRSPQSYQTWYQSAMRNCKKLREDHRDIILGERHDQDIIIE